MYDILIVEDEAPIANLIRMSLTQAGYRCTIATDRAHRGAKGGRAA